MDEGVVYVVGIVVTFFVFRWILNGASSKTDTAANSHSLEHKIERLTEIFPTANPALFREVLLSNGGSMPDAIEFFVNQTLTAESTQSDSSQSLPSVHSLQNRSGAHVESSRPSPAEVCESSKLPPVNLDPNVTNIYKWSQDPALRKQILLFKKQQMLEKARQKFNADVK